MIKSKKNVIDNPYSANKYKLETSNNIISITHCSQEYSTYRQQFVRCGKHSR